MSHPWISAGNAAIARPWPRSELRIWHLGLLVALVAVAIVNIQDQRIEDPVLLAAASAGFVGYGVAGWAGWRLLRRLEARLGLPATFGLYAVGMAGLFVAATVVYLVLEHAYRFGWSALW